MRKDYTTMVRRNVSVPDELDQRMRAWKDVNWSAVAASAFEAELRKLEPKETGMDFDIGAVAERLQATMSGEVDAAHKAGREWATKLATLRQLRRLEEWEADTDRGRAIPSAYGESGDLLKRIDDREWSHRSDQEEFWTQWVGEAHPETEILEAFAEGALQVLTATGL